MQTKLIEFADFINVLILTVEEKNNIISVVNSS